MKREEMAQLLHQMSQQLEALDTEAIKLRDQLTGRIYDAFMGDNTVEQRLRARAAIDSLQLGISHIATAKRVIEDLYMDSRNFPPEFPIFEREERSNE